MAHIPGYTYGTTEVARSPVSLEELEQLKQTMHFADEDHEYLRLAGEVLSEQVDELFEYWMSLFGPVFMSYFQGAGGVPDDPSLGAAQRRRHPEILSSCPAPNRQQAPNSPHNIG